MRPLPPLTAICLALASAAFAQPHPSHPPPASAPIPASPAPAAEPEEEAMPAMDWPTELPAGEAAQPDMAGMDHSGHGAMAGMDQEEVGDAPPPDPPTDHPADAVFGAEAMRPSRRQLAREHGGGVNWQVMIDQAEWRHGGEAGYGWNGEAWYGGDAHRFVLKTEGEGGGGDLEAGELQLLYSRAISPYFDLQAGLRQDFRDGPPRTYATLGFEGLAPYWFETEGALFLSHKGEVFARLEASYDLRLTQRLILQPRIEANLSGQDIPELELGAGLTDAEIGLRLRYEVRREFAPYVGVAYGRRFGDTADHARAAGEDEDETSVVVGLRAWF